MDLSKMMASKCVQIFYLVVYLSVACKRYLAYNPVLIFLSHKNSNISSHLINLSEKHNFSLYLGNTGFAQVKFSCFFKLFVGFVWLISLHLNCQLSILWKGFKIQSTNCSRDKELLQWAVCGARRVQVQFHVTAAPAVPWASSDPSLP